MTSELPSVVNVISKKLQKQRDNGELLETPFAIFKYTYLSDERFIQSPLKNQIFELKIPERTLEATSQAVKELNIKNQITITTALPGDEQETHYIIPSLGIGGRAISPTEVGLYFDLLNPNVIDSLKTWKSRQIAHELNHIARFQAKKRGVTLLDAIISEGLATYYEDHWGGEYLSTPWGHKLSEKELKIEWTKAQLVYNDIKYNHGAWFFGRGNEHPVWTGYSLGTRMAELFFQRHPMIPMRDTVKMGSLHIAKESGFIRQ